MKEYIPVLSIAGSDCSGGAGIQADLKTISALGGYAATAITAITVQNTCGVRTVMAVPPTFVRGQIEAVMEDIRPLAVKIGMINDVETARTIAESLRKYRPRWVVFDPVMVSTSGCKLIEDPAIAFLQQELFPLAHLITPNLQEAEVLLGRPITGVQEMETAAQELLGRGSGAVLLKGGHLTGAERTDVLATGNPVQTRRFSAPSVESKNTHGTGCTLSSAIATLLAQGNPLEQAVEEAKRYVTQGITHGRDIHIGEGHGPLNHFFAPIPLRMAEEREQKKHK